MDAVNAGEAGMLLWHPLHPLGPEIDSRRVSIGSWKMLLVMLSLSLGLGHIFLGILDGGDAGGRFSSSSFYFFLP